MSWPLSTGLPHFLIAASALLLRSMTFYDTITANNFLFCDKFNEIVRIETSVNTGQVCVYIADPRSDEVRRTWTFHIKIVKLYRSCHLLSNYLPFISIKTPNCTSVRLRNAAQSPVPFNDAIKWTEPDI
jgi:hypothetical protein